MHRSARNVDTVRINISSRPMHIGIGLFIRYAMNCMVLLCALYSTYSKTKVLTIAARNVCRARLQQILEAVTSPVVVGLIS